MPQTFPQTDMNGLSPVFQGMFGMDQARQAQQARSLANQQAQQELDAYNPAQAAALAEKAAITEHYLKQAGLIGEQTQDASLKNIFNSKTQDSRIKATNAENDAKLGDLNSKKMLGDVDTLINNSAISGDNPLAKKLILERTAKELGWNQNDISYLVNHANPDGVLQHAKQKLTINMSNTPEQLNAIQKENTKGEWGVKERNASGEWALKAAQAAAESRKEVAGMKASTTNAPGTDKVFAALSQKIANGDELTPNEWAAMENIARLKAAGQQQANIIDPATGKLIQKGAGAPILNQPTKTTAPTATPDIKTVVEKAGIPYEPNKYEYRIGPNGQLQRAKK